MRAHAGDARVIGVVVPAHNEEGLLGACLASILAAAGHPGLAGEGVSVVVVLDACSDGSAAIVERLANERLTTGETPTRLMGVSVGFSNVGMARHAGALHMLGEGARWLAFTDADTVVRPDWLVRQCASRADVVCGGVRLADWHTLPQRLRHQYLALRRECPDGRHVHGANLGVDADAYRAVGGFPPLPAHEDVQLVASLQHHGFRVAWLDELRVITSGRCNARAPEGLGARLSVLQETTLPERLESRPMG
ncbi:glycosyltransferase [Salinicola aestuarinus]|uniref:glycosyltransferase n=1 Tax=Salinicola aestuarinus TaxID=1949082 RepID=UPI001CB752E5|nr:glycosyltransferase family 2 protein [Salinicola aestuarinus]